VAVIFPLHLPVAPALATIIGDSLVACITTAVGSPMARRCLRHTRAPMNALSLRRAPPRKPADADERQLKRLSRRVWRLSGLSAVAPGRPRQFLSRLKRRLIRDRTAAPAGTRLIVVASRLVDMSSHRFREAQHLAAEAKRIHLEFVLLIHEGAAPAIRQALRARAVLTDPVFAMQWSFDERTARFVAMLHAQVDALVRGGDRVLITVATQCEARALAAWLRELPDAQKPWIECYFVSDRWNRYSIEERDRQHREFAVLAAERQALSPQDARRMIYITHTAGLAQELRGLLGAPVLLMPPTQAYDEVLAARRKAAGRKRPVPVVALLGGARTEKGSYLIPGIVAACRQRVAVEFVIQLLNETLSAEQFAALSALDGMPGVRLLPGIQTPESFAGALAGSDLALFPYERIPYRQRQSGIMIEAAGCGIPAVVPSGTWLAEQVENGLTAGTIFKDRDPERIADAVVESINNLATLQAKAEARAAEWRQTFSVRAYMESVEREIRTREADGGR
jgi:hypothetical protein